MAVRRGHAGRTDLNQSEIVDYLRRAGWSVFISAPLGNGIPDAVASCGGFTGVLEIKRDKNKLTLDEEEFRSKWQGAYIVGRTPEQTLKDLERARLEAMG